VNYCLENGAPDLVAKIMFGGESFDSVNGNAPESEDFKEQGDAFRKSITEAVTAAVYPAKDADPGAIDMPLPIVIAAMTLVVDPIFAPEAMDRKIHHNV